jgi:hypothetical protein
MTLKGVAVIQEYTVMYQMWIRWRHEMACGDSTNKYSFL